MAFAQLYYTSCEHGLGGYGGYQFNAVTPGVPPVVLREVEERTVYEPPHWLQADPEDYPVAFSYGVSEATGMAIAAHVVFTGTDYSGRPGNYFVHALASSAPERDFGPLLPAELWGAALWRRHPVDPVDGTELPELPGPPPRGVIDRPGVQAFLDAHGADAVLPGLLTAVGRAMGGARPVLVVSHDVTENAWWIAAVSYLLGERLAYRMTFTTYSHRPGYSRYHLTGILPDTMPADAGTGFEMFDFAAGRTPEPEVHPLAARLVSTGVMACPGLWQQAAAFASGAEQDLDDWLAPVAVAAGLLGRPLSPGEADAVARWLPGAAGRLPPQLTDAGLGVALAQPDGTLAGERLADLLDVARRLASPARIEQAEAALERYGRTRLDPAGLPHDMARVVTCHPAVLRGLLERLASEPPEVARMVLAGPLGARLSRDDLAGHPDLAELWLIRSVASGDMPALRAFDEIVDIRAGAERSPLVDGALLRLLWPGGCPPDQLTELLGFLTDPPAHDVLDWFATQIGAVAAGGTAGWGRLAEALAGHPILAMLPEPQARSVRNVVRISPLLERARQGEVDAFGALFSEYQAADAGTRRMLDRALPRLLILADPLGPTLRGCPRPVAEIFCRMLEDQLAPLPADIALARRLFAAQAHPEVFAQPQLGEWLTAAFENVRRWRRHDQNALARALEDDAELARLFRDWRDAHRGGLVRKFRGGAGPGQ